jgi:hypothetical protein
MTGIQTRATENTTVYGYVSIRSQIHSRLFLSKEWPPIPTKLRNTSFFLLLNSLFSAKLEGEEFFDKIPGFCQVIASGCTISCVRDSYVFFYYRYKQISVKPIPFISGKKQSPLVQLLLLSFSFVFEL